MTKPVIASKQALRDIDEAWNHYLTEAHVKAAEGFVDELQSAFALLGRQPGIGSSRYAHELNIPSLRSWPIKRYPYLIFYFEHEESIDVIRVLHGARDIPSTLA